MESQEIMNACKDELDKITCEYDNYAFDETNMHAIKETLNQNGIFTIGDLKKYTIDKIYSNNILTRNDQLQLKAFLMFLVKMESFELLRECKDLLDKLDDKWNALSFDEKSKSETKYRLNQNGTYTVGDLKEVTLHKVYLEKILTKRCWCQLKVFLQVINEHVELLSDCQDLLDKLEGDDWDILFFDDDLMRSAKYKLNRNGIFTIGDLKKYSLDKMYIKRVLTKKCWCQLKSYLQYLAGELDEIDAKNMESKEEFAVRMEYVMQASNAPREFYAIDAYKLSLENKDVFDTFYDEFLAYLVKSTNMELDSFQRNILFERIGLNGDCKTFQEIGDIYQISNQKATCVLENAQKRLASVALSSKEHIALKYERFKLIERIESVSLSGFLAYVCFEHNPYMAHTMGRIIYGANANVKEFVDMVFTQRAKCTEDARNQERAKTFNEYIYEHIKYKNIRTITREDFDRLNDGRDDMRDEVKVFGYGERVFECRSEAEIKILERLLGCTTFVDIKLHAIRLSLSNDEKYYPSFACLTDEKHFVIVDVADMEKGSANCRKEYLALRKYCERYGFGYLVLNKDAKSCF